MQQTEQYQFNLIEGSDSFLPEPLNDNARKTEAALAAMPRVHLQTWTGTGASSQTLKFPFAPKMVLVAPATSDSYSPCIITYRQEYATRINAYESKSMHLSWNELSVTFHITSGSPDPVATFSVQSTPYFALAIG